MLVFEKELSTLEAGSHLCAATVTPDENHEAMAAFLQDGIRRGECCVMVAPAEQQEAVCGLLGRAGLSTTTLVKRGAFVLRDPDQVYAPDGKFDGKRTLELMRRSIAQAHDRGFHAYRAVGAAGAVLGKSDISPADLASYEAGITDLMQSTHSLALCAFDRRQMGDDHLSVMLHNHPLALLGGRLCHNPFCDPPPYSQGMVGAAQKINWMINQTLHFENVRRDLGAMNHALIREAAALSVRLDQHRQREDSLQRALESRQALLRLVTRWLARPLPQLSAKLQSLLQDERLAFAAGSFEDCSELLADLQHLTRGLQATQSHINRSTALCPDETDLVQVVSETITRLPDADNRKRAVIRLVAPGRLVGWWDRTVLNQIVQSLVALAGEHESPGLPVDLHLDDMGSAARLSVVFQAKRPGPACERHADGSASHSSPDDLIALAIWPVRESIHQLGGSLSLSIGVDARVSITIELPRVATGATPTPLLQ